MPKSRLIFLALFELATLFKGGPAFAVQGQENGTLQSNLGGRYRIKQLGGRLLLDAYVEATQPLQLDKYLDLVNVSTPTVTVKTNHAILWFNEDSHDVRVKFDNGAIQILASSSSAAGTITGVTAGHGLTGGGTTGTVTVALTTPISNSDIDGSSITKQGQNVIKLTSTLQSGATFFVSSGTASEMYSRNFRSQKGGAIDVFNNDGTDYASFLGYGSGSGHGGVWLSGWSEGLLVTGGPVSSDGLVSSYGLSADTGTFVYGVSVGSLTVTGLSASLPVKTDSSMVLTAAAINLSGSEVTGSLPAASIASGKLGGSVVASSIAVNAVYPGSVSNAAYTNITGVGTQGQALNMSSHLINNVTDPVSLQDAATKSYVDTATSTLGTSILGLNNTWTGKNTYTSSVTITAANGLGVTYGVSVGTITGNGASLTHLTAGNIDAGTLGTSVVASSIAVGAVYPGAVSAGSYTNISGLGTVTVGTWNGSAVDTQHGGTSANLSGATQGALPWFNSNGGMGFTSTATAGGFLRTEGQNAPSWQVINTSASANTWTAVNTFTSSVTVTGNGGLGVTYGVIAGSGTFGNLTSGNCVQASTNGLLTTISGACGSGSGTVTSVTGTAPIASSGGNTPAISLLQTIGQTETFTSSITVNAAAGFFGAGNTVTLSSNTILPGATFYQNAASVLSNIVDNGLSASLPVQTTAGKQLTSLAVDLSGSQASGVLAAARFPALTGDITAVSGAIATTAAGTQTNIKVFTSSVSVTNALGLYSLYGASLGSATIRNLSASLPVQTDGSSNLTATAIDVSGSQATGVLAAGRFPALTGDITTSAGALGTTLATTLANAHTFTGAITISSNAIHPGATFYQNANIALGDVGVQVSISSNVILPGATFYQSGKPVLSNLVDNGLSASLPVFSDAAKLLISGSVQGNTTKVVSYAGSAPTTNDCAKFDSNGNLTTVGSACSSATGDAVLASTQTWTGQETWNNQRPSTFTYQLVVGSLSFVSTTNGIVGTVTNDSASAGFVGEFISSATTAQIAFPASGSYGDLVSIALTPGDWDVSCAVRFGPQGATATDINIGISTVTGNDASTLNNGDNVAETAQSLAVAISFTIPDYRVLLSAAKTVYLKYEAAYTGGPPKAQGRISARRRR